LLVKCKNIDENVWQSRIMCLSLYHNLKTKTMTKIKLYHHQVIATNRMAKKDKGIICMPTGTGKTYCQAAVIAKDIEDNPGFRMYVVNAPRIILTYQLLNEVYGFLTKAKIEPMLMFVHSGGMNDERDINIIRENAKMQDIKTSDINATTSVAGVASTIQKAKEANLPVIFFSTYNSADRIQAARRLTLTEQKISIVLNDEAHYLIQEQFHPIIYILKTDRCYFFTATIINGESENGMGMNNEKDYGKVIYQMVPRQAIDLGYMVRPRLHFIRTHENVNDVRYEKGLNRIIEQGFQQHQEMLRIEHQGKTTAKVLVSVRGTTDIANFIGIENSDNDPPSHEFIKLRAEGVQIYAVSSNGAINNSINGHGGYSRQEFLRRLKEDGINPDKEILVLHYDILSEGIDISGFSGIMPLRPLSKSKFLQTFGRAARPDAEDKKRIDKKQLSPNDLVNMNKPFAYIILPNVYIGNEDDKSYVQNLVDELRELNFQPSDIATFPPKRGTGGGTGEIGTGDRNEMINIYTELEDALKASLLGKLTPEELYKEQFE